MRIIKDARNPNRQVREAGTTVLNRKENKIIDADTLQAERLAVRIADANAATRDIAPVIIAREVKA